MITKEIKYDDAVVNGFLALFLNLIVLPLLVVVSFMLFKGSIIMFFLLLLFLALAVLMIPGYFSQEPNEARVMVFFGKYKGTFTETGFFWVNPFMNKKKLSLRARNLDVEPIKVNDKIGNPILIGLVLVWKLKDTYKAMFEIDAQTMADNRGSGQMTVTVAGRMNAFEDFVRVQSDAALRQVAGLYAYDDNEADLDELTLRSGGDEINEQLEQKLNERLAMAGMEIVEARINYLAYAPEIAAVMLRRQQASAIISAREKIVEGAVSMVRMALHKLSEEEIVELDDGIIMTVYAPGEIVEEDLFQPQSVTISNSPFNFSVPQYPSYSWVTSTSGINEILVNGQKITLKFDKKNKYKSGYQGIYDVTDNKKILDTNGNFLSGPYQVGSTLSFSNLKGGHIYKIALSSNAGEKTAIGTLSTN